MNIDNRPKVGLGVMVMKDGKVLFGRRNKASHGEQLWCLPGGHLEYGESFTTCARREVMEEAGIEIENIRFVVAWNELEFLPKHFVGLGFIADWKSGEPRPEEGDKMIDWTWCDPDHLPEPVFKPSKLVVGAYKSGTVFIDASD